MGGLHSSIGSPHDVRKASYRTHPEVELDFALGTVALGTVAFHRLYMSPGLGPSRVLTVGWDNHLRSASVDGQRRAVGKCMRHDLAKGIVSSEIADLVLVEESR